MTIKLAVDMEHRTELILTAELLALRALLVLLALLALLASYRPLTLSPAAGGRLLCMRGLG